MHDRPYISGNRTDTVGRHYGQIEVDRNQKSNLSLVSGASSQSYYNDLITGTQTAEPWGSIAFHITLYNIANNTIGDYFRSYAHDAGDTHRYIGRVVYAGTNYLETESSKPKSIIWNEYSTNVGWAVRYFRTGTFNTNDIVNIPNHFLWDIRDIDGDGVDEVITSPTKVGQYLGDYKTILYNWDEATQSLKLKTEIPDAIPYLVGTLRGSVPYRTSSATRSFPVLTTRDDNGLHLILRSRAGTVTLH